MFRRFLKDSAIYGIGGILARALSLLLLPFYTRVLTPHDYGVVDLLATFGALVNLTVALEVSQGLARYVAETSNGDERAEWASTALWFTVGALAVFAAVALVLAPTFSEMLLDSGGLSFVFSLGVVMIVVNGIFNVGRVQLRWMRRPALFSIASLAATLGAIAATILFVLVLKMGVVGAVLGQGAGFLLGAILTLWFARSDFRMTFSWSKCRRMLRFSLPLVPSSIAVFVAAYIDRFAIKELMTLQDVGVYGVAYRLASPVGLLTAGFATALTPLVVANHRDPATRETIARIFRYFLVLAMLAAVGISVFAREVLAIFATPAYAGAARLVPLLAPAVLLPTMYVFAPGLFIAEKTRSQGLVIMLGAVLNTILNFTLIPILGTMGSALSSFISGMVAFSVFMALSQREYRVPHDWSSILLGAGGCVVAVAFAALVPVNGLRDVRGIAVHALIAVAAAVWLPVVLLGKDELMMIGRKTRMVLARGRG